ncbi:MAG: hypothetical protein GTN90_12275 [Xanthomonadales bacterium]|nr:hypothetical protein [Xanthomonadales bacterium]
MTKVGVKLDQRQTAERRPAGRACTWLAAACAALLATTAPAQDWGDAPHMVASNGAIIAMPAIDGLTCPQMAFVLHRIDLSTYRGPDPLPKGHADYRIFDYEDRLTRRYYYACMMNAQKLEDPSEAFSFGFGN